MSRSLPEWLAFIEGLHPREIELGLDRVRVVAERLDLLSAPLAPLVVTVTGTNGKGSLVHALQGQCRAAGRAVLAYTSPHLVRFNERVCLDGAPIPDTALCEAFEAVHAASAQTPLTYFEYGTLAMLWICRQRRPDVLLLEVGMGGRLDAVNVVDADIAVVTSIGLDHCDWLGGTREEIGFEKAGIYRANRPAICADRDPPASLARHAAQIGAQWLLLGPDFDGTESATGHWQFRGRRPDGVPEAVENVPLPTGTDPDLAAVVFQVCLLSGLLFTAQALDSRPPGRWQVFERSGREIILDVAHNPQATGRLAQRLARQPARPTRGVFGLLAGRDPVDVTRPLWPLIRDWLVVDTEGPRGCSAESLSSILEHAGQSAAVMPPGQALDDAIRACTASGDRVLVFGSFQVVGAMLSPDLTQLRTTQPWTG